MINLEYLFNLLTIVNNASYFLSSRSCIFITFNTIVNGILLTFQLLIIHCWYVGKSSNVYSELPYQY